MALIEFRLIFTLTLWITLFILKTVSLYLLLRRLWYQINLRHRVQFGLLLILMIVASFAEIVSIGAVLPFLGVLIAPERVFEHQFAQPFIRSLNLIEPKQLLLPLTIVFSIAALFSGAVRLALIWAQNRLSHAIGADFSTSMYRRTLYQPYAVHVARNSSHAISAISVKATRVVYEILLPILIIFSSGIILFVILVAMLVIEPIVALAAFAGFGSIYLLVILITKKQLVRDSHQISQGQSQVLKVLQEGLGGIREIIIDGTQATYCKIYSTVDRPLRRAQANIQIIGSSPRFGVEALGMVLIAALAFSLAGRSTDLTGAIPIIGAMALSAQRLLPLLQQSYSSWASMRGGQATLQDALELLELPLPAHANGSLPNPLVFKQDITINNLSFRYTTHAPWVLQGLGLAIPKGSRVGFIGSTGSGKSTLLDIIMGLLQPTKGSLAIDGVTVTPANHRSWQVHIAHVPQAIFLADTTIAENIAFGVPLELIDYSRVRQAAEKAQIAQTIDSWDHKYGTVVGERGVRLSGGQRQRIGIARALYKQADVIVFDEATSALDNDTEYAVMRAIESLGQDITVLIVAHRLTTLKNCCKIVELCNGNIRRIGTYAEIIDQVVS